jgi:transketolase
MTKTYDCRLSFSSAIMESAEIDERIVVVCNDSVSSASMVDFQNRFPKRLINVGIAEQNMIGVAVGLANAGFVPIVCAASCFLCARAYEQIKVDVGYSKANVKLFGVSPGFAYGALGATHHSPEDIALIHSVPGILIAAPSDPNETKAATVAAIEHDGPTFVRVLRSPVKELEGLGVKFQFGQSHSYGRGPDVLFITNGLALHRVIEAIPFLSQKNIESTLVNASSVRPLDSATVLSRAASCRVVVTVEEGNAQGGLGSAVSKLLAEYGGKPVLQLGVAEFAPTGSTDEIFAHFKLDATGICTSVVDFMERTFTGQRAILHSGLTR